MREAKRLWRCEYLASVLLAIIPDGDGHLLLKRDGVRVGAGLLPDRGALDRSWRNERVAVRILPRLGVVVALTQETFRLDESGERLLAQMPTTAVSRRLPTGSVASEDGCCLSGALGERCWVIGGHDASLDLLVRSQPDLDGTAELICSLGRALQGLSEALEDLLQLCAGRLWQPRLGHFVQNDLANLVGRECASRCRCCRRCCWGCSRLGGDDRSSDLVSSGSTVVRAGTEESSHEDHGGSQANVRIPPHGDLPFANRTLPACMV